MLVFCSLAHASEGPGADVAALPVLSVREGLFAGGSLFLFCSTLVAGYLYQRQRTRVRSLRLELRRRTRLEADLRAEKEQLGRLERQRSEELVRANQALLNEITERERVEGARFRAEQELERAKSLLSQYQRANHDLNNMLAVIIPSAQLGLEECPSESQARGHLQQILATALKARGILRVSSPSQSRPPVPPPLAPSAQEDFGVGGAGPKGKGQHILLVDDEPAVVRALAKYLEMSCYKVTVHTHPKTALAAFAADPKSFDMVITDRAMPELSGTELSRKLVEIRPELPVLLITGYGVDLDPQHVQASGIRKVLAKPVPLPSLLRHIHEQWLKN